MSLIEKLLSEIESRDGGSHLDQVQHWSYCAHFEIDFLKNDGAAFESRFANIMTSRFPGAFQAVQPYGGGPSGDLKCDGFLEAYGVVFQSYAPTNMQTRKTLSKIDTDFRGAVEHWCDHMQYWVFVHNQHRGLPAEVVRKLADLRKEFPGIGIESWSMQELAKIVLSLPIGKLIVLYGLVPSEQVLNKVGFEELLPVLIAIDGQEPSAKDPPLGVPSPNKLSANNLSPGAVGLLQLGRRKEKLVQKFYESWKDAELGERTAQRYRDCYADMVHLGLDDERIFQRLQEISGGMRGTPERQASVMAVMSYFFEHCDIFKNPEGEGML